MDGSLWPQRWFIRNTSNDLLTDRITDQTGFKNDLVTLPKPAVTFPNSAVTMPKRPVTMDRNTQHGNYVIFFESTSEQVTIVRILHGARDISEVLNPS